jgi:hypothetical protein
MDNLELREDLNRNSYELLRIDIDTALTFTRIASGAEADKRSRNQENARRAYDSVQRLRKNVAMTAEQEQELDRGLETLRTALQELGEKF